MSLNNIGLKKQLLQAATPDELDALMDKGATYEYASEKTRRQWRRNANRRYNFLTTGPAKTPGKKDRKKNETATA